MKRNIKIILSAAAGLISVAVWIFTLIMLDTVNSEKIFFLNSELGKFYASAYRIFAVVSAVILIVWIIAAVKFILRIIKRIKLKLRSGKSEEKQEQSAEKALAADAVSETPVEGFAAIPSVEVSANDTGKTLNPIPEIATTPAEPFKAVSTDVSDLKSVEYAATALNKNVEPAGTVPAATSSALSAASEPVSEKVNTEPNLVPCGQCGKSIPAQAIFCPFCGSKKQPS